MNNFEKNGYYVLEQAINKDLATFIYNYFLIKRQVHITFRENNYISPFNEDWGTYKDKQVPETYSHYADIVMETLLIRLKDAMEKVTNKSLIETYSYARIYKKGDILERHKDRPSCQISTTLNLGGDEWPIFVEPDKNKGKIINNNYISDNTPGTKIILKPGDMLIYKGCDLEHWRKPFEGEDCAQVFLHYNDENGEFGKKNLYDGRPHIGLPSYFKNHFKKNEK